MLTEREVRELAGAAVDTDQFPRPNQYGPSGRKWLRVGCGRSGWQSERRKRSCAAPKGEGESVETRPVE